MSYKVTMTPHKNGTKIVVTCTQSNVRKIKITKESVLSLDKLPKANRIVAKLKEDIEHGK